MSHMTVTMYQLVCDLCGDAREAVEKDEVDDDRAAAIDFDCWNEVEDGIYCGDCSWRCRCGKAFRGNPPPAGKGGESGNKPEHGPLMLAGLDALLAMAKAHGWEMRQARRAGRTR